MNTRGVIVKTRPVCGLYRPADSLIDAAVSILNCGAWLALLARLTSIPSSSSVQRSAGIVQRSGKRELCTLHNEFSADSLSMRHVCARLARVCQGDGSPNSHASSSTAISSVMFPNTSGTDKQRCMMLKERRRSATEWTAGSSCGGPATNRP